MADLSPDDVFGGETFLTKLCDELDSMYPAKTPGPQDELAKIMYLAGQRSVVEYILAKSEN
jgi:hypothetical protein